MTSPRQYLAIPGTRYRCSIRLVSADGLDDLAQFFYDHVLEKENRISFLIHSFGLPQRVLEDVLAELLETNRASLDVWNGRILKSGIRRDRRTYLLGPSLDLWQDDSNGTVLPLSMVQSFHRSGRPDSKSPEVWFKRSTGITRLLDTSGARALSAILASDPGLRLGYRGMIPDGLVDMERISSFDLRLTIDQVEIDEKKVEFVEGVGLPPWLTRSWSFELATASVSQHADLSSEERSIARAAIEKASVQQARSSRDQVLRQLDLTDRLMHWRKGFDEIVQLCRDSVRQRNGFALEHMKQKVANNKTAVADLIMDSGRVEVRQLRMGHLGELWRATDAYMLFVRQKFTVDEIETIWNATEQSSPRAAHLILVEGDPSHQHDPHLERKLQELSNNKFAGELVFLSSDSPINGEFCIVDGQEAWLGTLQALLSGGALISVRGAAVMRHLSSFITSKLSVQEGGGWWVSRRFAASSVEPLSMTAGLSTALVYFNELNRELEEIIDELWLTTVEDTSETAEQKVLPDDLADRLKELEHRGLDACNRIRTEFLADRMLIEPIPRGDLFTLVQQAIDMASSGGGHELDIMLRDVSESITSAGFFEQFRRVVTDGSKVRFGVGSSINPQDNATQQTVEAFKNQAGDVGVEVYTSDVAVPFVLILDTEKIAFGWGSWFDGVSDNQFGFASNSADLAQTIKVINQWRPR